MLDAEAKRLRKLSPGDLADEVGVLEARIDALKGEAIRRELHRAEGQAFKITLTRGQLLDLGAVVPRPAARARLQRSG
jgi:hypothetical protein